LQALQNPLPYFLSQGPSQGPPGGEARPQRCPSTCLLPLDHPSASPRPCRPIPGWTHHGQGVGTECGSHRRQQGVYVAMSQVQRVAIARCGNSNSTHSGLRCGCCGGYTTTAAPPTAGGTAATNADAVSDSVAAPAVAAPAVAAASAPVFVSDLPGPLQLEYR
jgi:hypothetical protein